VGAQAYQEGVFVLDLFSYLVAMGIGYKIIIGRSPRSNISITKKIAAVSLASKAAFFIKTKTKI